ncbi:MAG TPA: Gfo/Idh/MocA family oxidoreductase [Chloroflexota bacterium]|nr:Gfo/Idh/MocA family oxidoreductase [Chloroflexota bacterium]
MYYGPTIRPPIQSDRSIRVGIVGYGSAGRRFHPYLIGRVPDFQLAAVATRSPERRAQAAHQLGVATFETVDDLLAAGGVDLVVVVTPHDTHADIACRVMNAGVSCVVEKIFALNAAQAQTMIDCSRRNHVLLSVFQNRRWDWDFLTVKKVVHEGLIGDPFLFEVVRYGYRAQGGWRGDPAVGGGLLFDWGAHFVDQALQLVPQPVESVTCDIQYRGWGEKIGSYARLLIRFAGDVLYSIEISNLARAAKPHWLVLGERGSLVKHGFDPQEGAMLAGDIDAAKEDPNHRARVTADVSGLAAEMVVETVRGDWTSYYRNVADALRGRAALLVTPEQALRAMTVVDAAMQSAKTGETIRVMEPHT